MHNHQCTGVFIRELPKPLQAVELAPPLSLQELPSVLVPVVGPVPVVVLVPVVVPVPVLGIPVRWLVIF